MDYNEKIKIVENNSDISIKKQCEILSLNRSSLYYKNVEKEANIDLKDELLEIYESKPFYGYRRALKELKNKGYKIGKKKVINIRKELGLETFYPKKRTTIIRKDDKKYPYLLLGLEINKPNIVWSIDITYVKVKDGNAYMVGIIDWYSRRILSHRVSNTMEVDFCLEALEEAIKIYGKPDVFNSDQGSQFTSEKFTSKLIGHGIKISMDGKGRWADNIIIERFFRTFKYENVFLKCYENMYDLKIGTKEFIEFYNSERFHSSLNYETPDSVYFGNNKTKIDSFCKIDKDFIVRSMLWFFVFSKNLIKNNFSERKQNEAIIDVA